MTTSYPPVTETVYTATPPEALVTTAERKYRRRALHTAGSQQIP